jgi:hypothetical protein
MAGLAPILSLVNSDEIPEGCRRLIDHNREWFIHAYEQLTEIEEAIITKRDGCYEDEASERVATAQQGSPLDTLRRCAALAAIKYQHVERATNEGMPRADAIEQVNDVIEQSIEKGPQEAWVRIQDTADALYPVSG